jgi:hypothetical protein
MAMGAHDDGNGDGNGGGGPTLATDTRCGNNTIAKTLYVSKCARPDVSTAIAFLTTRVRAPDVNDWRKVSHLMEYLRVNRLRPLILSADGRGVLMWYVDASFAGHSNMRSHTGGGLTMGRGFPIVSSTKQKLNTRSSTESELVGVDKMMPNIVVWSRYGASLGGPLCDTSKT